MELDKITMPLWEFKVTASCRAEKIEMTCGVSSVATSVENAVYMAFNEEFVAEIGRIFGKQAEEHSIKTLAGAEYLPPEKS